MNSVILTPQAKTLYQIQPQNSHPSLSLRRVLWVRFLRWIDKALPQAIQKLFSRVTCFLLIAFGVFAHDAFLQTMVSALTWNGFKIPVFVAIVASLLNAKRIWSWAKRKSIKTRTNNQHTYHGIPVGEFAAWLIEVGAFKRDEAMSKWAFSQGQYAKVAAELEEHGVLCRGENNARVLREITMENLVLQLRDNFPLVWSEDRQVWAERNGTFDRWALSQDFKRRKLEETTERKERKLERIEKKIEERSSFADVMALCG